MIALPLEIKALIIYLVPQGLKSVAKFLGKDINGGGSAFAVVVTGTIIFFIEGIINLVPEEKKELVSASLAFTVSLLSAFGIHYTYKELSK